MGMLEDVERDRAILLTIRKNSINSNDGIFHALTTK